MGGGGSSVDISLYLMNEHFKNIYQTKNWRIESQQNISD